jgi:integrase
VNKLVVETRESFTPEDVASYRAQRVRYPMISCAGCGKRVGKSVCSACGWRRDDRSFAVSVQTVNHDHTALTRRLNVAKSPRFRFIHDSSARHVEKPDPRNERDIASAEEWTLLKTTAAPHLLRFLTIACTVGPRKGELLGLEWSDVDMRRREFTHCKTKNGEPRMVPMTPDVSEVLLHSIKNVAWTPTGYSCIREDRGRIRELLSLRLAGGQRLLVLGCMTCATRQVRISDGQGWLL